MCCREVAGAAAAHSGARGREGSGLLDPEVLAEREPTLPLCTINSFIHFAPRRWFST